MDEKRRSKRKPMDEGFWDCSVCTYKNTPEAFKCEMCDVRKGTSTRKPRLNPQLVAQQVAQQFPPAPPKKERSHKRERDRDRDSFKEDSESLDRENSSSVDGSQEDGGMVTFPEIKPDLPKSPQPAPITTPPPPPASQETKREPKERKSNASTSGSKKHRTSRLKNIDLSSGRSMEVTVGDLTVIITDYKPKKDKHSSSSSSNNASSNHNKDNKVRSSPQQHQQQQQQQQQQPPSSESSSSSSSQSASSGSTTSSWSEKSEQPESNGQVGLENKNR